VACWSQKRQYLKRVKVSTKSYYGGPIGNHQRSFERYHLRPPTASSATVGGPKTQNSSRYYLRDGWSYGLQIWQVHSQGPSNKSPLEKGGVGVSRDCSNFLVPPIISGTDKATNLIQFKFCAHIHCISRKKSPLKISGQVAVGIVRDSKKIFKALIYRAHRAVIFAISQLFCTLKEVSFP